MRGGVVESAVPDKAVTLLPIDLHPSRSMQTVVESRSAGPFFAEPGRFEWCRSSAAGMCSEYSLHRKTVPCLAISLPLLSQLITEAGGQEALGGSV